MGRRLIAVAGLVLMLGGCATSGTSGSTSEPRGKPSAVDLVAEHDLAGRSAVQVVEELDAMTIAERPDDLMASVQPEVLRLTDGDAEATMPMPVDRFYLSVAPYVDSTHDCFHHSPTTCRGELADQDVRVRITTSDGDVLVDQTRTTYANGFVGFWLPRGVEGTVEVRYDGRAGRADFATRSDSPTCLTTLRLV